MNIEADLEISNIQNFEKTQIEVTKDYDLLPALKLTQRNSSQEGVINTEQEPEVAMVTTTTKEEPNPIQVVPKHLFVSLEQGDEIERAEIAKGVLDEFPNAPNKLKLQGQIPQVEKHP